MGPRPHLVAFEHAKQRLIRTSEILVSMGPSPHLWILHAKQRLYGSDLQVSMGPRLRLLICELQNDVLSIQND